MLQARYEWLRKHRRCFLVQFLILEKFDLPVCVHGRRRLMWDSEQEFPLELNYDSLRMCSGVVSRKVRLLAMKMVKQVGRRVMSQFQ